MSRVTAGAAESNFTTWRLLPYDLGPSDRHFALSDALARHAPVATVWAHSTNQPTVIVGAGQDEAAIDVAAMQSRGVGIVRRQAGGTSVFAGPGVLGVDVALPRGHPLVLVDVVESYRWLGEVWMHTMQRLGVDARIVSIDEARSSREADPRIEAAVRVACFGSLSPYEVVSGGRKLVGFAQVRRRAAVLWQSGIYLHFDAETLASLIAGGDARRIGAELHRRAVGLDEVLPSPPTLDVVVDAFLQSLTDVLDIKLRAGVWTAQELEAERLDTFSI
jgi:lipoate---protein ligase